MISIRPAKKNEVTKLQSLNQEVFIDNHKYDPDLVMDWAISKTGKEYFTKLLHDPTSYCLVAEDNEKLVGYIAARKKDFGYRKSKYLEIENMGVNPTYRSQGIGSQLMQKCLEWAKKQGYQKVYVNAYFANNKAITFYKQNGFSEIDVSLEREL